MIFVSSLAFVPSALCIRSLPDRRATAGSAAEAEALAGPERHARLDVRMRRLVDGGSIALGSSVLAAVVFAGLDAVSASLIAFFGVAMLRKALLDALWRRAERTLGAAPVRG